MLSESKGGQAFSAAASHLDRQQKGFYKPIWDIYTQELYRLGSSPMGGGGPDQTSWRLLRDFSCWEMDIIWCQCQGPWALDLRWPTGVCTWAEDLSWRLRVGRQSSGRIRSNMKVQSSRIVPSSPWRPAPIVGGLDPVLSRYQGGSRYVL